MKGLSQNFQLVGGRFQFTADEAKAKDGLDFFMQFNFVSRIYNPDFTPGLLWILQKPYSMVLSAKNLLLGSLQRKILQYVPMITIDSLDTLYDKNNKEYAILVNYQFDGDDTIYSNVTFI